MEKIIKKLVSYMVKNNIIQDDIDTIECYEYGMTLVVTSVIIFIAMIVCSLPSNLTLECCVFAVSFCPMRALAGGYHCKRFWSCFIISLAYWIILEMLLLTNNYLYLPVIIIVGILSGIYIVYDAPMVHINNPIDNNEIQKIKRHIRRLLTVYSIVFAFFAFLKLYNLLLVMSYSLIIITLLMICEKKGVKK